MATGDVQIVEPKDITTRTCQVAASATLIYPGEPVKVTSDGSQYVIKLATGDPEIGTDELVGIAANTSDNTAAADGTVEVYPVEPGITVLRCKATTAANIDTQSEIDALVNDCVTFDLTGTTFTIDEDETHDNNVHGLIIIGGDPVNGTLDVLVKTQATQQGSAL